MVDFIEIKLELDPFITLDLSDREDEDDGNLKDVNVNLNDNQFIITEGFDEREDEVEFGLVTWYQCPTCQVLLDTPLKFLEHRERHIMEVKAQIRLRGAFHRSFSRELEEAEAIESAATQILSPILFLPKMDLSSSTINIPGFPCPICTKRMSSRDNLRRHLMVHTGEKPYACHLCNYKAIQKNHLQSHMLHNHSRMELEREIMSTFITQQKKVKEEKSVRNVKFPFGPFRCEICNVGFKKNDNLQRHNRERHKEQEDSLQSSERDSKPIRSDIYQVPGCKSELCHRLPNVVPRGHVPGHGKKHRRYGCSECGKIFGHVHHLKKHKISAHPNYKQQKSKPSLLMSKETSVRSRVPSGPASCTICARVLCNLDSLRRHILIHQGIKPFPCPFCAETFRQKHHLTSHLRKHDQGSHSLQEEELENPSVITGL